MKYWKEGIPPIRALVLDYEEEADTRNVDDEYLFGDSLLVAPMILEDGTCRSVYLPRGTWHDFFDGTIYEGGKRYQIEAGYDKIPVFVKDGCILPFAEPVEMVTKDTIFKVHPRVYGTGSAECVLYEDDFESFAFAGGKQNKIILKADTEGHVQYERIGRERIRYDFELS